MENLWKTRGWAVHELSARIFFSRHTEQTHPVASRRCTFRTTLRLRAVGGSLESSHASPVPHAATPLRFEETINGRPYVIEVLQISPDRWRAHIARTPGATTALMPFYGPTPDEAAQHLTVWLQRAGRSV